MKIGFLAIKKNPVQIFFITAAHWGYSCRPYQQLYQILSSLSQVYRVFLMCVNNSETGHCCHSIANLFDLLIR